MTVNGITRAEAKEMIADNNISSSERTKLGLTDQAASELSDKLSGGKLSIDECLDKIVKSSSNGIGFEFYCKDKYHNERLFNFAKTTIIGFSLSSVLLGGLVGLTEVKEKATTRLLMALGVAAKGTGATVATIGVGTALAMLLFNTGIRKKEVDK